MHFKNSAVHFSGVYTHTRDRYSITLNIMTSLFLGLLVYLLLMLSVCDNATVRDSCTVLHLCRLTSSPVTCFTAGFSSRLSFPVTVRFPLISCAVRKSNTEDQCVLHTDRHVIFYRSSLWVSAGEEEVCHQFCFENIQQVSPPVCSDAHCWRPFAVECNLTVVQHWPLLAGRLYGCLDVGQNITFF